MYLDISRSPTTSTTMRRMPFTNLSVGGIIPFNMRRQTEPAQIYQCVHKQVLSVNRNQLMNIPCPSQLIQWDGCVLDIVFEVQHIRETTDPLLALACLSLEPDFVGSPPWDLERTILLSLWYLTVSNDSRKEESQGLSSSILHWDSINWTPPKSRMRSCSDLSKLINNVNISIISLFMPLKRSVTDKGTDPCDDVVEDVVRPLRGTYSINSPRNSYSQNGSKV